MLNAVREIGNFAAHPIKSDSSAEVIDVEIGEAETNLDVLEELFDEVFVKPTLQDQKLEELNRKLASAGRKLV